jgi:hypothetical protein
MECKDCLFFFDDYIADELEAREISEVSEHLAICESCALSYEEFRRQQQAVERYLLRAEASTALWMNLQTQIRNENVVPLPSRTTISGKFKSVFENFGLIFSPRRLALSALVVVIACAFVFLLVQDKNHSPEYAQNDPRTPPISEMEDPIHNQSSAGGENEKEDFQTNRELLTPMTTAKKVAGKKAMPAIRRTTLLYPRKKSELKKTKTIAPRDGPGDDLLPGEQEYLKTIARLTEEIKSIEPEMPPVLTAEYKRNLSAVDKAIEETRKSARLYPQNRDVMNFVISAYQGKIALLNDVAKQ